MTRKAWAVGAALILVATACGSTAAKPSQFGDSAPFGSNDDQCASARLLNEPEDESILDAAVDCFFEEYDAGRPVTIDIDEPTVEGDSIFHRYRFDGELVLIVEDTRADEFGTGYIRARTCARVERTNRLPEGFDCTRVSHPGFREADQR